MNDLSMMRRFLSERRRYRGLTQQDMATTLGLSRDHYARIERGETPLQQQTFLAIRTIFADHDAALHASRRGDARSS